MLQENDNLEFQPRNKKFTHCFEDVTADDAGV